MFIFDVYNYVDNTVKVDCYVDFYVNPDPDPDLNVVQVPEMIPELIVPDLEDCKLKPYVSYATKEILQQINSLKKK